MSTSKRWCFTLNNWTQEEYDAMITTPAVYLVIGKEIGKTGTPHLQGFATFQTMQRMSAMQKISKRAHWETAYGTTEQAAEYCKKDGDYEERGVMPKPKGEGEKERWAAAKKAAQAGKLDDIPEDIYVRYYRTLKEIAKDHMVKPDDADDVTGVWLWGAPGVGKSRKAREDYPGAYFKMQNKWWDGYQGEEYVILDDYDSKELGHLLKIWADRYSFMAETKGGALHIRPKKIVITSNYSPEDPIFDWDDMKREAIMRRMTVMRILK